MITGMETISHTEHGGEGGTMGERRLLDVVTDRLTLIRRMRILRHRTARWFLPPVRQSAIDPLDGLSHQRSLTTASSRRNDPSSN